MIFEAILGTMLFFKPILKVKNYLPATILLLGITAISAQEVVIKAELDTSRALIGDQLKLSLYIEKPEGLDLDFPQLKDTITREIEIVSDSFTDTTVISPGRVSLGRELIITVFDTGYFKIPSLNFVAIKGQIRDSLRTSPLSFEIISIKADSTIHDIKSNLRAPVNLEEILYFIRENYPVILLVLGLIVVFLFIVRYIRRKLGRGKIIEKEISHEPPEVIALRELEKIREDKPWLHGRIKIYHIRLSEVLRRYIEGRFSIIALELTTDEILQALKSLVCQSSEIDRLAGILKLADLVKFAKAIPTEEENALQVNLATEFVQNTSHSEEEIDRDKNVQNIRIASTLISDNA